MTEVARVGIVVRTKNRPWFLNRALQDIDMQEFDSWKVHIVNDGGDVGAVEDVIAAASAKMRERLSVTHNQSPRGRSAAANQGVQAVDTEFVALHDDDDLWHPSFLAETVAWLDAHPGDIGVATRTDIVFEERGEDGVAFVEVGREPFWADMHEIRYTDLLEVNRWVPIAYLYRRELHEAVGYYDENIHAAEDWDLGLRTLAQFAVGYLDGEALAYWMHRRGIEGELGNSMFVLADEHERYGSLIRDRVLREYVAREGAGLPLYLAGAIAAERTRLREDVRRIIREEVALALAARPSIARRVWRRLRAMSLTARRER